MSYDAYYTPPSIAPILANAAATQVPLISQPKGLSGALPAVGQLAQTGFDVAANNQKKQSVMQAQQAYSQYLAKVDDGTATQQDHAMGRMAAISLGIQPPDILGNNLKIAQTNNFKSETDSRNSKDAPFAPEVANAIRKKLGLPESNRPLKPSDVPGLKLSGPSSSDQNLTPEEMKALQGAMTRPQNPLAPSMVSFRGPRAKLMAQSLMSNPNWSPNAGESGLAGSKAGAGASARLTEGGSSQVVARTAQSAAEQLDLLQKASNQFPRANVQIMNTPIIALARQGSPAAQKWLIAAQTARAEYATALNRGNSPSNEQMQEATKALPDTITPGQLPGAIQQLRAGLSATVKGQMTPVNAATDNPGGNGGGTNQGAGGDLQSQAQAELKKRLGGQ